MHQPPPSPASARFRDRQAALTPIRSAAAAAAMCPSALAVYRFGSFAYGVPTPCSDTDILVVIADDADREQVRRCCLEAIRSLPEPVDLFVWTEREVAASLASGQSLPAIALRQGIRLR